jgi:hypothetical protein
MKNVFVFEVDICPKWNQNTASSNLNLRESTMGQGQETSYSHIRNTYEVP